MSPNPFPFRAMDHPPVITITPATLVYPPSPPLTPAEATEETKSIHITPISPPPPTGTTLDQSLHYPLTKHLALLHPSTPKEIISFVATRLLSKDRPYGHQGTWEPIYIGCGDLSTAGVGMEAGKGCRRKEGEGKRKDEEMERMYTVARESFRLLELKSPGVDKL